MNGLRMTFTKYRLYQQSHQLKNSSKIGLGISHVDLAIWTVAKHTIRNPYMAFNEALSFELGRMIGIPIVSGFVISGLTVKNNEEINASSLFWASISIGEDLPPAEGHDVLVGSPDNAYGLVVFDAWILNNDRNEGNLTYDNSSKSLLAFDHEQAICNTLGPGNLRDNRKSLKCLETHAVAYCLTNLYPLVAWLEKVQEIAPEAIWIAVKNHSDLLPDKTEFEEIANELIIRQKLLPWLFYQNQENKDLFPSLEPTILSLPSVVETNPLRITIEVPSENENDSYSI